MFCAKPLVRLFTILAGAVTAWATVPALAQGDLLVAPTRVVLTNGGNAELVLSNIGAAPATYRIGVELRRMTADGDFEEVTESEANATEQAAAAMIRYAPRRITLSPGQPQSVRLSARPGADLPDGEYRVHLSFRAVPGALQPEQQIEQAAGSSGLSVRLTPIYGITIPVFVRKGALMAKASLDAPRMIVLKGRQALELTIRREGNRSVYGELIAKGARGEQVFNLRGIAVYPEVSARTVQVALNAEQLAQVAAGPVTFEYREMPENGGQLLAAMTAAVR